MDSLEKSKKITVFKYEPLFNDQNNSKIFSFCKIKFDELTISRFYLNIRSVFSKHKANLS